jgi:hypothetical protein
MQLPSVLDFGAVGDGQHDDGPALQAALDACVGSTLLWPWTPNGYRVTPQQDGIGLYLGGVLHIMGIGAGVNGTPKIRFDNPQRDADCLVIERYGLMGPRGAIVENLTIESYRGDVDCDGRYGIVVHHGSVQLLNVRCPVFGGPDGYFIVAESGVAGTNNIGKTRLAAGTVINCNFLEIRKPYVGYCGDEFTGRGGAIYCHGPDSAIALYDPEFEHNGHAVVDMTQLGIRWYGGHSEAGFNTLKSGTTTRIYDVDTEDRTFADGTYKDYIAPQAISVGAGSLRAHKHFGHTSSLVKTENTVEVNGVEKTLTTWTGDALQGAFTAAANDEVVATGLHHFVDWLVPGGPLANADKHEAEVWGLGFSTAPGVTGLRGMNYGIAITGPRHVAGPGLPHVSRPWMNSAKEWRTRQAGVVLQPGAQVVRLWPDWNGSKSIAQVEQAVPATSDTAITVQAVMHYARPDPTVNIGHGPADMQMAARAAELLAADVEVGLATVLYQDIGGGNFGVKLTNHGQTAVTVDLLWHFVQFVPSAAGNGSP